MSFTSTVFINCPFDDEYKSILKAIYFTLTYLDLNPVLSETSNSADSRIEGIMDLIAMSKYSIHDLSRMEFDEKNKLARFNMPFELGLDLGARRFGGNPLSDKCLLILDKEKYRYQQALSDISGKDVEIHKNQPEVVVRKVRNWIRKIKEEQIDSANKIWRLYVEFTGDFFKMAQKDELSEEDIDEMPWDELSFYIKEWLIGRQHFEDK